MENYKKYKNVQSGKMVSIPEHWDFVKLKYVVTCNDDAITINEEDNFSINYIEIGDVNLESGVNNYVTTNINDAPSRARRIVRTNDIIISTVRTYLKAIAKINESQDGYVVSTGFAVLRPQNIEPGYLNYAVQDENFISVIISMSVGASYPAITSNNLINISIPLPSKEEQLQIAKFLDHQTEIIDHLTRQKESILRLLKEKWLSDIFEIVTKGINCDSEMRESGIKWIGQIPKHWKQERLKFLYRIKKEIAGELGHNVLSVTQKGIRIRDVDNLKGQLSMDYSKYQLVNKGDFIMNHMDLLTGFIDISKWEGVTSPDYRVFSSIGEAISDQYYLYIFQLCYHNKIFFGLGQGVSQLGRWRMPAESFNNFVLPCPPYHEQIEIVKFLDEKNSILNSIIDDQELVIQKLKEYRRSIISEAVTGKIDVREWQPNKQQIA